MSSLLALIAALVFAAVPAPAAQPSPRALPDDPSPTSRDEGNNPTIAQKLLGLDAWARSSGHMPDVLILGSSRSVMIDPQQIERLTGLSAYNAGISSGAARELLAVSSYADLRSGGHPPRVLVMLDLEAFDNRRPTARVVDYQQRIDAAAESCDGDRRCELLAARRITLDAIARQRTAPRDYHLTQRADGRQINGLLERLDAQGVNLGPMRDHRIQLRIASYRQGGFDSVYPAPRAALERMLALLNSRGVEPVFAITSMHPKCIRLCGPAGWSARRQEVRAMLDELQVSYDFRYVDLSYPASWGGTGADFYDEIHLRPLAAAKVVRRLAAFGAFEDA